MWIINASMAWRTGSHTRHRRDRSRVIVDARAQRPAPSRAPLEGVVDQRERCYRLADRRVPLTTDPQGGFVRAPLALPIRDAPGVVQHAPAVVDEPRDGADEGQWRKIFGQMRRQRRERCLAELEAERSSAVGGERGAVDG